jgi:chromosome partitioning protein
VFKVNLVERAAYKGLFKYGGTLTSLDPRLVNGIPAAIENARAFAAEVISMLKAAADAPAKVA